MLLTAKMVGTVAIWLAVAAAVAPPTWAQAGKTCKFRTDKCMSRCVQNNPESVCLRYCRQGIVCAFETQRR
jgi:hypothetical protein